MIIKVRKKIIKNGAFPSISHPAVGMALFILIDGTWWHASRLRRVPVPLFIDKTTYQTIPSVWLDTPVRQSASKQDARPQPRPDVSPPRPTHTRSRPGQLQDFISTLRV